MKRRPTFVTAWWGMALGLVVLAAASRAAFGQDAMDSACAYDTVATFVDTLPLALVAPPRDVRNETAAEYAFRIDEARRVGPFVRQLTGDTLLEFGRMQVPISSDATAPRHPTRADRVDVTPMLWFQVDDRGRLAGAHLDQPASDSSINSLLVRAVLAANDTRALRPLPPSLAHDPISLWVGFSTAPDWHDDTVLDAATARGRLTIFETQRPGYHGPATVVPRLLSHGALQFPPRALRAGVEDTVTMRFVIARDSTVELPTVRIISAHFREFAESAARFLKTTRYAPELLFGCPVATEVEQTVMFQITH